MSIPATAQGAASAFDLIGTGPKLETAMAHPLASD